MANFDCFCSRSIFFNSSPLFLEQSGTIEGNSNSKATISKNWRFFRQISALHSTLIITHNRERIGGVKCVLKSDNFKSLRQSIARKYVAAIQHDEKKENVCNSRSSMNYNYYHSGMLLMLLRILGFFCKNIHPLYDLICNGRYVTFLQKCLLGCRISSFKKKKIVFCEPIWYCVLEKGSIWIIKVNLPSLKWSRFF